MGQKKIVIHLPFLPDYDARFINHLQTYFTRSELFVCFDPKSSNGLSAGKEIYCNHFHIKTKKLLSFYFTTKFLRNVYKISPEIIVFTGNTRDFSLILYAFICKLFKKKILFYGMYHRIGGNNIANICIYHIHNILADKLMTYSQVGLENLIKLRINPKKISKIGTGDLFQNEKVIRSEKLIKRIIINSIMRISTFKKSEGLLYILYHLKKSGVKFSVNMIKAGDGLQQFQNHKLYSSVSDNICWHKPTYDKGSLDQIYSKAHLSLFPTCVGLAAHQSLSYGLPIVTDDSKKYQASEFDICINNKNSLIYEHGNFAQAAELIIKYCNDLDLQNRILTHINQNDIDDLFYRKCENFARAVKTLWK